MTGVEKSEVKKNQKAITSLKTSLHICKKEEDDVLSDFFLNDLEMLMGLAPLHLMRTFPTVCLII